MRNNPYLYRCYPHCRPYEWTHYPVVFPTTTAPDMEGKQQVVPTGWVCPKCGIVNAPFVAECRCSSALAEKG
jgi:hypothetical protein